MTNQSVSENSRNDLILISSTIIFHLILRPQKRTYLPVMSLMEEGIFSTFRANNISSYSFPSTEGSTICDMTLNNSSSLAYTFVTSTVVYQHTAEK